MAVPTQEGTTLVPLSPGRSDAEGPMTDSLSVKQKPQAFPSCQLPADLGEVFHLRLISFFPIGDGRTCIPVSLPVRGQHCDPGVRLLGESSLCRNSCLEMASLAWGRGCPRTASPALWFSPSVAGASEGGRDTHSTQPTPWLPASSKPEQGNRQNVRKPAFWFLFEVGLTYGITLVSGA